MGIVVKGIWGVLQPRSGQGVGVIKVKVRVGGMQAGCWSVGGLGFGIWS